MENLSVSDIMWNLKSGYPEISYRDTELALIKKEQQLKAEKIEMEAKYKGVLEERKGLKKQRDEFRRDNKAEVRRRSGFKEKLQVKEPDSPPSEREKVREKTDALLQKKIRFLEAENDKVQEKAKAAERRERGTKKEMERLSEKVKGLVEEKREAEKRENKARGEIQKYLQKIESLEKEKAETERSEREVRGESEKHLQKIECLERERAEAERGEGILRGEIEKLLQMIEGLKKEKAETERGEREVRGEMEKLLHKIGCLEDEKREHLKKIGCLEDEKEKVFAESEKRKQTLLTIFKDCIDDTLSEDPVLNLSGDQAKSTAAYDRAHADVEDRLDTNMKEKSNSHSIHTPKLSGQSTNPSMLVSGKPTASPLIDISDSESDNEGVHLPHGLKRKRDSFGSLNTRLVDNANNENFARNWESLTPMELSYGSVNHSPTAVASGYDQTASRPLTAGQCSDEELEADESWQFEAEMLNAFNEDPILTMQAVCALYRQQITRGNGPYGLGQGLLRKRGFDAFYASRGTALAEFLLDGNPQGGLKKSVEDLQLHDPNGLDECKQIGNTHSRQLFEIYQREEDPFFGPK